LSFIPGYIASLTINGADLEPYASDASLTLNNDTLDKTTLGTPERVFIPGLQSGSIDIQMHLDTGGIVDIQAAFSAANTVAFVFRPGALGAGTDAGQWSGQCIIDTMGGIAATVDDNWSVAIGATISGPVSYTSPI